MTSANENKMEVPEILEKIIKLDISKTDDTELSKKDIQICIHFIQTSWYDLCNREQRFLQQKRRFEDLQSAENDFVEDMDTSNTIEEK